MEVSTIANITHKLEILVNAAEPVAEINNVISAFLQLHAGKETEILTAVKTEIDAALSEINGDV